jgi:Lon protease-like protein
MKNKLIPFFPLQSIVLPGGLFPLRIFERRYLDMVRDCIKNDTGFCITLIRNNSQEDYVTDIYNYGCYVKITDWNQLDDGLLGITVEGVNKVKILSHDLDKTNLLTGTIENLEIEKEYMIPQKHLLLSRFYKKIYPGIKHVINFKKERYADASWVSFRLIECLPLDSSTKNKLIAIDHAIDRLDMLSAIIQKIYAAEVNELMSNQQ